MDDKLVMYIVVNKDLKMEPGKVASQVGHVVQLITEEIIRMGYESFPTPQCYIDYIKWKFNCTKIILRATEAELKNLIVNNKNARYVIDQGHTTQVEPNSLTVVGFYPCSNMSELMKNYKLY